MRSRSQCRIGMAQPLLAALLPMALLVPASAQPVPDAVRQWRKQLLHGIARANCGRQRLRRRWSRDAMAAPIPAVRNSSAAGRATAGVRIGCPARPVCSESFPCWGAEALGLLRNKFRPDQRALRAPRAIRLIRVRRRHRPSRRARQPSAEPADNRTAHDSAGSSTRPPTRTHATHRHHHPARLRVAVTR